MSAVPRVQFGREVLPEKLKARGDAIREMRVERGFTKQKALAAAAQTSQSRISDAERSLEVSSDVLCGIAVALRVDLEDVAYYDPPFDPELRFGQRLHLARLIHVTALIGDVFPYPESNGDDTLYPDLRWFILTQWDNKHLKSLDLSLREYDAVWTSLIGAGWFHRHSRGHMYAVRPSSREIEVAVNTFPHFAACNFIQFAEKATPRQIDVLFEVLEKAKAHSRQGVFDLDHVYGCFETFHRSMTCESRFHEAIVCTYIKALRCYFDGLSAMRLAHEGPGRNVHELVVGVESALLEIMDVYLTGVRQFLSRGIKDGDELGQLIANGYLDAINRVVDLFEKSVAHKRAKVLDRRDFLFH